jgi:hypothetical protein
MLETEDAAWNVEDVTCPVDDMMIDHEGHGLITIFRSFRGKWGNARGRKRGDTGDRSGLSGLCQLPFGRGSVTALLGPGAVWAFLQRKHHRFDIASLSGLEGILPDRPLRGACLDPSNSTIPPC